MSNWPIAREVIIETVGAVAATSKGTPLVTSTYVELIAATKRNWSGMVLYGQAATLNQDVKVAIGASGSEQDIVESFEINTRRDSIVWPYYLPVAVPAGSRVSCLTTGNPASGSVIISGFSGGFNDLQGFSHGTRHAEATVDPGGTIHTKGSWVEIIASTAVDYKALMVWFHNLNDASKVMSNALVDLAVGADGSEQIVIADFSVTSEAGSDTTFPGSYTFPVSIPAGSRIAARAQSTNTTATDRNIGLGLIGFS